MNERKSHGGVRRAHQSGLMFRKSGKLRAVFHVESFEPRVLLSYSAVLSLPALGSIPAVEIGVDTYSFSLARNVQINGGSNILSPVDYSSLTLTLDAGILSPQILQDVTTNKVFPTAKLTLYNGSSPAIVETMQTAQITDQAFSGSSGDGSSNQSLTVQFASLTQTTLLPSAAVSTAGNSLVMSYTPTGSSSAHNIQLSGASFGLSVPYSGSIASKPSLSSMSCSESGFSGESVGLFNELVAGDNIGLVTITRYAGGVAFESFSLQDCYFTSVSQSEAASSLPSDSIGIAFGTVTVDYATTTSGSTSIATYNVVNNTATPLSNYPQPPTGVLRSGGGSSGVTSTTSPELDFGAPVGSGPSVGSLALQAVSFGQVKFGSSPALISDVSTSLIGNAELPDLLAAATAALRYSNASILFRRTGGGGPAITYESAVFNKVNLDSLSVTIAPDAISQSLSFVAHQWVDTYTPQNANGTAGTPVVRSWDYDANAPVTGQSSGTYSSPLINYNGATILTIPSNAAGPAVSFEVESASLTANVPISVAPGGGSLVAGTPQFSDLTIGDPMSAFSPALMYLLASGTNIPSGVTLSTYNFSGGVTSTYSLANAKFDSQNLSADSGTISISESFSLAFSSITQTYANQPNGTATPGSESLAWTATNASSPTTVVLSNSNYSLLNTGTKAIFSNLGATSTGANAAAAISAGVASNQSTNLMTVTETSVGGVPIQTYSMQDVFVSGYTLLIVGDGSATTEFNLAFATGTVDYSPTVAPSIATYNALSNSSIPLSLTPAPPSGTPLPNGGTPGSVSTSPIYLTLAVPTGSYVGVGSLAPSSVSFGYTGGTSPSLSGISVTLPMGSDAPDWFRDAAVSGTFPTAVLTFQNAAGTTLRRYNLTTLKVTSFAIQSDGRGGFSETVTLQSNVLMETAVVPSAARSNSAGWNFGTGSATPNSPNIAYSLPGPNDYVQLDSTTGAMDVWYATSPTGSPDFTETVPTNTAVVLAPYSAGSSSITIDYTNGSPTNASGFLIDGTRGTAQVNLKVIGTVGNDTFTINDSQISLTGEAAPVNYVGLQSIALDTTAGLDTVTQTAQPGAPLSVLLAPTFYHTTLNINAGTFTFPTPAAGSSVNNFRLQALNISSGALVTLPPGTATSDRILFQPATLTVNGTLDITKNDIDITHASLATYTGYLTTGYANGHWNGSGIVSSTAAGDTTHLTTVGVIANNPAVFTSTNPFDGMVPGSTDVLIRYTYYGDATISGATDSADYSRIDNGFLHQLTGWLNGDFNYDTVVNGSDYTLIDNAFNRQHGALAAQIATTASAVVEPVVKRTADAVFAVRPVTSPDTLDEWMKVRASKSSLFASLAASSKIR